MVLKTKRRLFPEFVREKRSAFVTESWIILSRLEYLCNDLFLVIPQNALCHCFAEFTLGAVNVPTMFLCYSLYAFFAKSYANACAISSASLMSTIRRTTRLASQLTLARRHTSWRAGIDANARVSSLNPAVL